VLSETTLDFGEVRVGDRADLTVVIRNSGNAPLVVESIRSDNPRFTFPGSTAFTLAPGTVFDLRVVFAPTAAGEQKGVVLIRSNDSASPAQITVTGTGR
jgi:hypothetical protein